MISNLIKNFIWITPCGEYARILMSKKEVVVKKRHFYTIFSHLFQFYDKIAASNCIFHHYLKTRINLEAAREIRILIAQKNELIWFLFHFRCFRVFFLRIEIGAPPCRWVWTPTARHQAFYSTITKGRKKTKPDIQRPRILANICLAETVLAKNAIFLPIFGHGFQFCPQTVYLCGFIFSRKLRLKCELLVKCASHYPYSIGNYDFFLFKNFSNF